MKSLLTFLTIALFAGSLSSQPFITVWKTDNPGASDDNQITIPTTGTGYNYDIYWESTSDNAVNGTVVGVTGNYTITFPAVGTYTVEITGDFPRILFAATGDSNKILDVKQWGNIAWTSMSYAFAGCENLGITAIDAPDLSGVTSLGSMFFKATNFNGNVGHWDVSNITTMANTFREATSFNQNLNSWDVGNVTSIAGMFYDASAFNQSLSSWDVTKVTSFGSMFSGATSFNKDLSSWDVSNASLMRFMFYGAESFNQNLNGWNMANVTNISNMFEGAISFNQDISSWDVSNITDMSGLFTNCAAFNQDISGWNVGSVTNMRSMFRGASSFNQNIGAWNVSSVTDMSSLFNNATVFNQDIGAWDVSNVIYMSSMFLGATSFNQDIGGWLTSSLIGGLSMFSGATAFNQSINNWDMSHVTILSNMFFRATSFNGDISSWDVSSVVDMRGLFNSATNFNQDISSWNVSKVEDMGSMFSGASSFDQDISGWDVGNVTDMSWMFSGMSSFSHDITGWDVSSVTNMDHMFFVNSTFDQEIGGWNVASLQDMGWMFTGAAAFSRDISSWDVSKVSDMNNLFYGAAAFNVNIGSWDISSATDMTDMLSFTGLSTENYDMILQEWASTSSIPSGMTFGASSVNYCDAIDARQNLTNDFGWVITDNGRACQPTDIVLSNTSIDENVEPGTLIGILTTSDKETEDTFEYSFSGGEYVYHFLIEGHELRTKEEIDFESYPNYSIQIRSEDSHGLVITKDFEISVINLNETPTISNTISDKRLVSGFNEVSIDLPAFFGDPDGDVLAYSVALTADSVLNAVITDSSLILKETGSGTTDVFVTADDSRGGTAELVFNVWVNTKPIVINAIPDMVESRYSASKSIDLSTVFSDPDGEVIFYSATIADQNVAWVAVNGSILNIVELGLGATTIAVNASDNNNGSVENTFVYAIKNYLVLTSPISDQLVQEGFKNAPIDIASVFSYSGDSPSYSVTSSNEGVASVELTDTIVEITEVSAGQTTITIVAENSEGSKTESSFLLTINATPVVSSSIEDQDWPEGFGTSAIDLSSIFTDPDGDLLTLQATSSNESVVTVKLEGLVLNLTEAGKGSSTISLSAEDEKGGSINTSFNLAIFDARLLGAEDKLDERKIEIYPNPSVNTLNIKGLPTGEYKISIVDLSGKKHLVTPRHKSIQPQIEISELPQGIYLLLISSDGSTKVKKFIKE